LIQLTDVIQPLPKDLLPRWPRASRYYGPNGERLDARPWDYDGSEGLSGTASDSGDDDQEYDELEDSEEAMEDYGPPKPFDSLEKLFGKYKPDDINEEEEEQVLSLLRSIFQYDSSTRPSVTDLLEHPWIKG